MNATNQPDEEQLSKMDSLTAMMDEAIIDCYIVIEEPVDDIILGEISRELFYCQVVGGIMARGTQPPPMMDFSKEWILRRLVGLRKAGKLPTEAARKILRNKKQVEGMTVSQQNLIVGGA